MEFIEKVYDNLSLSWELKTELESMRFMVVESSLDGKKTFTPIIIIGGDVAPFKAFESLGSAKKFIIEKYQIKK